MAERTNFLTVPDLAALASVLASNATVFLHDPWCPISASAYEEMEVLGGDVHLIDVSEQHDLKRELQRATGIRHESPQVIVMRGGTAVWDASHGRIRTGNVRAAIGG